ncbi:DUF5107 domain-containing protein [Rathayibacter sp. CAU 1779]
MSTTARVVLDEITMPSGDLGPTDPLPPIAGSGDLHKDVDGDGLDDELRFGLGYGKVDTVLPYLMQDGYTRETAERAHPIAVLEDDRMRAEFLIGLGGRLWSLVDKRTGRELLHRNPVFRPANLALRNAWFAGGVEWNLGTTGHWPLTCSPLHTVRVRRADGTEVLRMYEYERMRGLVVRIDASLAPDAPLLVVSVTIRNPRDAEVPVYWWSNIAVPERDDVRVLAPAESAYRFGYEGTLSVVPFPDAAGDGVDRSYTTRSRDAADYFFELGRAAVPWIAALDGDGSGLFHASTPRLRGRKLFLWGSGPGSAHWQRWLTEGEHPYLEIQAGLARTQLEHLPMPANTSWRWTEVYGLAESEADAVNGSWSDAVAAAAKAVEQASAPQVLAREEARDERDEEVVDVLQRASGWGALEDARRTRAGVPALSTADTPFPASDLGPEQEWWLAALDRASRAGSSAVPSADASRDSSADASPDPAVPPLSYQVDQAWAAAVNATDGWLARLHDGMLAVARGDWGAATAAWRASVADTDNGWAWRNLAVAAMRDGDPVAATDAYAHARTLLPQLLPLSIEAIGQLLDTGRAADALAVIESLDAAQRADGRIRYSEARASLAVGDVERCGRLLDDGIEIADLKEGEASLDGLWLDYQAARLAALEGVAPDHSLRARAAREFPPPARYDFRMHVEA